MPFDLPENGFVISVPGATSGEQSLKSFGVYEFPASEEYRYRMARYIAPRSSTGAMRRLYKIAAFLLFVPADTEARENALLQAALTPSQTERLNAFLAHEALHGRRPDTLMRYFITDGTVELLRFRLNGVPGFFPTVSSSNQFRCYFLRNELLVQRRHPVMLERSAYAHLGYYPSE